MALPYIERSGDFSRIAWSFRASGAWQAVRRDGNGPGIGMNPDPFRTR